MKKRAAVLLITALLVSGAAFTLALPPVAVAGPAEGVTYLRSRQTEDGGFAEPESESDPFVTCWAVIAGKAAGQDPLSWKKGANGPGEYLSAEASSITELSEVELLALALATAGSDPRDVEGTNLVTMIKAHLADDGMIGETLEEHCWGMIALAACGEAVPASCTEWLAGQQREDGGWGDYDDELVLATSVAVEALVAGGEARTSAVDRAMALLKSKIEPDGGFSSASESSDALTTSMAISAIVAAGGNPSSAEYSFQGNSPAAYLASLQAADGHYKLDAEDEMEPVMVTAMAVPAAAGKALPLGGTSPGTSTTTTTGGSPTLVELGRVGASSSAAGSSTTVSPGGPGVSLKVEPGAQAGASATTGTGHASFWFFLALCGVYIVVLAAVAIVVALVARPRHVTKGSDPLVTFNP
ncbi:MAG: terpene cyclase/mutase family protein [Actinobacteria bacterium]|nr:terpene cyclase/mutase family protein [Actinomycetota bacterium]MBU1943532.1 terpene cyclase/mutase family protein [Actinomycetota bacterium]MBU2687541.1 terpene cyclase/mutase family protein [Actinomycetota bacterium]